jgi:hypothetical protein
MVQRLCDRDLVASACRSAEADLGQRVGVVRPQLLVFLRSRHTVVIGVTHPRPAHTMWMPQPCSKNDMNEASTPFDLAGGVPEWRKSRSRSSARVAVAGQQAKHIRVASEAAIAARAVAGLP